MFSWEKETNCYQKVIIFDVVCEKVKANIIYVFLLIDISPSP